MIITKSKMLLKFVIDLVKLAHKTFELKVGWFFVNGQKQESWVKRLKKKYSQSSINN